MEVKKVCLSLFLLLPVFSTPAQIRNLCDDLIDSKTEEKYVQECFDKYGKSSYRISLDDKKERKAVDKEKDTIWMAERKANIEYATFTDSTIKERSFGKSIYAFKHYYNNQKTKIPEVTRISEGDHVCRYLGYEKVIKSVISPEIYGAEMTGQGIIVDTTLFGDRPKIPDVFKDTDKKMAVRKYLEITCAKRKDVNADPENVILKDIVEDVQKIGSIANPTPPSPPKESTNRRSMPKEVDEGESSKFGYRPPEWATTPK